MITITRIQAWAFRSPTKKPVATSFGVMHDRPAVLVRVEARDGAFGWGEIWANWPAAGAEHRLRLLEMDVAHLVLGVEFASPTDFFYKLDAQTRGRAVQCGEVGPFAQVIAGLVYERDSITQQATTIGQLETVGLSWRLMDEELSALEAVTPEDIQQAARTYFTRSRLSAAHVLPEESSDE